MKNDANSIYTPVGSREYDSAWIQETWGWDDPESFIRSGGRNLRPRVRRAIDIAELEAGMRILDIGCGRGEVVLHCGRLGMAAVGVDYSRPALEIAEKAKAAHSPEEQTRMRFVLDDVKNLTCEDPFDRIFMLDLVEHLYDWELLEVLDACRKLLAPGGRTIVHTLPNRWVYEITYRRLLRLIMPWLPSDPRSEKERAIHVNEMTVPHLSRLLRRGGFQARVWLEDQMVAQARWHRDRPLKDRRDKVYRFLGSPLVGAIFRALAGTPIRLLIVNDIFAVAWREGGCAGRKIPLSLTERGVTWLAGG